MKTTNRILNTTLVFAAFLTITLTSCDKKIRKNGSGVITTTTRQLGEFSDLDVDGSYDLFIHESDEQKVTITTDDNIVGEVHTFVQDGKLNISMSDDYYNFKYTKMEVHVYNDAYNRLDLNGSVNVTAPDSIHGSTLICSHNGSGNCNLKFSGDELQLDINGSANIQAAGVAPVLHAEINGSGKIDALDLQSVDAVAKIHGSGDIYVNCSATLDAWITGSGDIRYIGGPSVTSHIDGSGSIAPY
ncbi:MAG: DUF2807 domain-containing protein [Flavobacteriales bacterium]|nr:DUF2807 domain-containing protein [Flavobacteriales bacterium]